MPAVFLLSAPAIAGDITLFVESTTKVTGRNIDAQFLITNKGTESAVDVSLKAALLNQHRKVWIANSIIPGNTETAVLNFKLPANVRGTFPIFVTITYHSLESVSFSSAALAVARTAQALVSKLAVNLEHKIDKNEHVVHVELIDASSRLEQTAITCHVPDDLAVSPKRKKVNFKNNRAGAVFHIENLKGLPGSKYGIFVTAEYVVEKTNYLAYSSILIPIKAEKKK